MGNNNEVRLKGLLFRAILPYCALTLWATISAAGQQFVQNPEKPLSKNAGRTIILKEVMRIRDDGKETIFRGPYDLQVGEDSGHGMIFQSFDNRLMLILHQPFRRAKGKLFEIEDTGDTIRIKRQLVW